MSSMTVRSFVESSAQIARVISLDKNTVYKRATTVYGGKTELSFGVVTDVMNNGELTVVSVVELQVDQYEKATVKSLSFSGDESMMIYPATVEEFDVYVENALVKLRNEVANERRQLGQVEDRLESVEKMASGIRTSMLSGAAWTSDPLPVISPATDD